MASRAYTRGTLRHPPGHPGPDILKLDSNEGLDAPQCLIDRLTSFLHEPSAINHYPDEDCLTLRKGLSNYLGCDPQWIVPFCGADGALEAIARAFLAPGDDAVLVTPGYDQFRSTVELAGARPRFVGTGSSVWHFDCDAFLLGCRTPPAKLTYLINPNSPVGYVIDDASLLRIAASAPDRLLIVDETYMEFAPHARSAVRLLGRIANLVVVRSFSKAFGLASLRLGYAVASPSIAQVLDRVRNVKAVTSLAQLAGLTVLENKDHFSAQVNRLIATRAWFVRALRGEGIAARDTNGNFVLIECDAPAELAAALARRGIRVRDLSWINRLERCLRISISTRPVMERVLQHLIELVPRMTPVPPQAGEMSPHETGSPKRLHL